MNKKPVALRTTFAIVVILVFGMTIFLPDFKTFKWNPVTPSNFYVTLEGMLTKKDEAVDKVIALAKAKQEANTFAKIIDSETNKIDITKYDPKGKSKSNREFLSTLLKNYIKAYKTKDSGDFYAFLEKEMKPLDQPLKDAIAAAKVGKGSMYPSVALEEAAMELGANLTEYVKGKGLYNNRDVISLVRKKASGTIRLGLDLAGGAEFLLELVPDKEVVAEKEKEAKKDGSEAPSGDFERYRDMAIEVLRNRMESQNIFETEISPAGGKYISLRVPVVSKDEKLKLLKLIQMSAKLEFRLVHRKNSELVSKYVADPINFKKPVGFERMTVSSFDKTENKAKQQIYFVQIRPEMTGKGITRARPYTDQFGQREIQLSFNHAGAAQFGKVTTENVGRQLAIVLDGKCYSAPNIQGPITGGQAVITGSFSREEAQNISNALESGSLPVRIKVEAVFDTDPTLGKDAVANGLNAGLIGLIVVIVFMAGYYLLPGLIADLALALNVILVLGALAAFEATLTLPGIAGIILTIGMAVDANVLIFERIREELDKSKTLLNAIETGYSRAFTTILDANLTTLFVALILYWQGSGAIKGFAITLSIGIATSMFTALFITRLVFDLLTRYFKFKTMKMWRLFSQPNIDFLKQRYVAATVSGVIIVACFIFVLIKGNDILGIDFTGGTQLMLTYQTQDFEPNKIEDDLAKAGYKGSKVTIKTSAAVNANKILEIVIRGQNIANEAGKQATSPLETISNLLQEKYPTAKFKQGNESSLGALIGWEFTKSAIFAMVLAIIGIIIYISLRFEFAFAIASIIALVHDVLIATGLYLAFGRELSLPVIAALLTIIGYSLNDTIVVFDRIRENLELIKNKSYREIIILSINQTLSRTLLTSLTTLLVLVVLFVFGGVAINNFVFVMITGVVVGTYSSIFVASPIVAVWHKRIGSKLKEQ